MLAENRPSSRLPVQDRFERTDRCGRKPDANSVTLGDGLANTVPVVPSAQRTGTNVGSTAYCVQSGIGTAGPTQKICWVLPGSPVLSSADPIWPEPDALVKTPTPPRITARGPRAAPAKARISSDSPT